MSTDSPADQHACTERLLEITPDAAVVSNLGVASFVLAGVADRERNFYEWGSMGVTTPLGLGLALAVDDQVTVLDGDGSLIMSLGSLATVSDCNPSNLTIVVWDNEQFGTTGGQPSLSRTVDFVAAARAVGLDAARAETVDEFAAAYADAVRADDASLVVCTVEPTDPDGRPPKDFAHVKRRFRSALGDAE